MVWPRGGVVTQRTANPCTPVRFRARPPPIFRRIPPTRRPRSLKKRVARPSRCDTPNVAELLAFLFGPAQSVQHGCNTDSPFPFSIREDCISGDPQLRCGRLVRDKGISGGDGGSSMLTGELRNQIDGIWNDFWSGGLSNPLQVIEQLTYLIFIKRLDEMQELEERKANTLGIP